MNTSSRSCLGVALAAASFLILASCFILAQGPLTPPGTPAPTMNYLVVAGNSIGAIVVPPASATISGIGAVASSLGTTDPGANFSK